MRYGILSNVYVAILVLAAGNVPAQGPEYNLGQAATTEDIAAWGIIVGPNGDGLPAGSGTAVEGSEIYAKKCAYCHGPTGAEPFMHTMREKPWTPEMYCCFPAPLVGGEESLTTLIPVKSVGAYWPSATTLWDYINRAMPPKEHASSMTRGYEFAAAINAEGPLSADELYALTAFILAQSDIIKKTDVMDADSLPKVHMPGRDVMIPANPGEWYPKRQVDPHVSRE